jgi:KDO2-lipid IV(A) lauroyltransferase
VLVALFRLLSRLPLRWLHALGAALGWVTYLLSPTYRRRLRKNLAQAGLDSPRLRRSAVGHAGRQAIEAAWLWHRPLTDIAAAMQEEVAGSFSALLAERRPLLLLTPHLGSFEAVAQYYATLPDARARPMTVLYREPRKAALRPLMHARGRPGLLLAPADMRGVRMLMRALKQHYTAGILPDQVPSRGDGAWVDFFGRPAYTMTLPARLAAANDARIVFVLCVRQEAGNGYRLRLAPFDGPLSGDVAEDTLRLNRALETLIRQCPEQYLWGYHRYKSPAGAASASAPQERAV